MSGAMARGEARALAASYKAALREAVERLDEPALLALRGELQVAQGWFASRRDEGRAALAGAAVDAVTRLAQFTAEIRGFGASRASAERASVLDLGAISVLAVENLLTAERITPMRLFMSGLSEGLMFLASRQYVHGGNAVLEATYRAHRVAVQDALWSVAMDFREPEGLESLREARRSIDDVFGRLDDPGVPIGARVALLHVLYALVAIVRCARLLKAMDGDA
jgi:hypothetical protein